ncbi:MAG: class I SAM-dependent methyltransferase [Hyphomicrobiaceae bacterium]|nr:class I SAM-dependent methyltransferase [Hyphomicrobiaceae bacterium]
MAVAPDLDRDAARHMDGIYRTQRHIYDATRKFYLLGRDSMLDGLQPPAGGSVLEIGCGTGRNLVAAARRYPGPRLYGFDISEEMLSTARQSIARANLADRVTLATGDASRFSANELFGVASFDRVFISYAVSMIPPWREALACAMTAVAPGGELHVVDFGQQAGLPAWFQAGLTAWLARFCVTPRGDLEGEMARIATDHGGSLRFARLYRDYARYDVIARPS